MADTRYIDARTSEGWGDVAIQALVAVAPYLAKKGQRDDEAWGLYSQVINAVHQFNMEAEARSPFWDSGIRRERD